MQDDLGRDLGWLEGRHEQILWASRESLGDDTVKVLGWAAALLSSGFGFADVLLTGSIGTLAGLSLAFGIGGFAIGLLMDRREDRRQRARSDELAQFRQELVDVTTALARVRAARLLRPSAPARTEDKPTGR